MNLAEKRRTKLNFLRLELYSYLYNKKMLKTDSLTTPEYAYLSRMVNSIDQALSILSSQNSGKVKVDFIKDKYFYSPSLDIREIANKHYVHENTTRNWDYEFLCILSEILGLTILRTDDKIKLTARR